MRIVRLLPALVLVLGDACVHPRPHPHGLPPGQVKKLVHEHGEACGHALVDGVWVVVELDSTPGHAAKKPGKPGKGNQ